MASGIYSFASLFHRLKEDEAGQAAQDGKNWWPGFQGGPTRYVWHGLPRAIEPLLDSFPTAPSRL